MTTPISQVEDTNYVQHCLLVALQLDDVNYYLSTNRRPLTFGGNSFNALGWLLQVS